MLKFNKRLKLVEQGFTLVEVLVAIVIATIFIGVAMQMTVFAALFKIKAQEYAEATNWIQEDLENKVKYEADRLQFQQTTLAAGNQTTLAAAASANSTSLNVISASGFNAGDKLIIGTEINHTIVSISGTTITLESPIVSAQPSGSAVILASKILVNTPTTSIVNSFATNDTLRVGLDPTNYKITAVSGTGTTRTLTLSPALGKAQATNALLVATKMCTPSSRTTGLADWLRDKVTGTDITTDVSTVTNSLTGRNQKQFIVSRTTTLSSTYPYSVLDVMYSVAPTNAHTTLSAAASATSTTLSVGSASGFKVGDKLTVGTSINHTIASISGNSVTLASQLGSAQPSGSIVNVSVATANTEVIPNVAFQCP